MAAPKANLTAAEYDALSARGIAAGVASGAFTAEAVATAALAAVDRHESRVGAFLVRPGAEALARARALDLRRAAGETLGPLAGVPVVIKDNICVAGVPCTCASKILAGYVPPYDATVVERLLAADAVLFGKANLDEFAMGSSTENSAYQVTKNPWDETRVPGGSSGGSAAAVAAGFAPLSLGSDTGGSIRQPGALCGLAALKPTYGRVSRFGLVAFGSSLDQIGPFARNVDDMALAYGVIGGHDPRDSTSAPRPLEVAGGPSSQRSGTGPSGTDPARPLAGRTIAFPESVLARPGLSPEVVAATRAAAATFEKLGATLKVVDFPDLDAGIAAYYLVATAEASSNLARFDGVRYGPRARAADLGTLYAATRDAGFGPEVKRRIMLGTYALSSGYYDAFYGKAMRARITLRERFGALFRQADLILIPTSPTPAFKIGEKTADPLEMYLADVFTVFANLIGGPALSIPGGFSREGLPLGLQLVADDFHEAELFDAARAFEAVTDFHSRRPALVGPVGQGGAR